MPCLNSELSPRHITDHVMTLALFIQYRLLHCSYFRALFTFNKLNVLAITGYPCRRTSSLRGTSQIFLIKKNPPDKCHHSSFCATQLSFLQNIIFLLNVELQSVKGFEIPEVRNSGVNCNDQIYILGLRGQSG